VLFINKNLTARSWWPYGLRRGPADSRLLGLRDRMPSGAWISVSCECCVLSSRRLCVGLMIVHRSLTECGVSECDREASILRRPWPTGGCCTIGTKPLLRDEIKLRNTFHNNVIHSNIEI
jgi:hypothetical protein